MPRYPFLPGICISSATSFTTIFSGVTISNWKVSDISRWSFVVGRWPESQCLLCEALLYLHWWVVSRRPKANDQRPLLRCFQLLRRLQHFINRAFHVKRLLGDIVVLAFVDFLEALYRVRDFNVAAGRAGELLGDVERLRQEALDFSCSRHANLLVFAQFVNAKNRDNVLQILIGLQCLLHALRYVVVILAHDARIENARSRSQRIDRWINSYLGQGARKHR